MNKFLGMTAVAALLAGCADKVEEVIVPTDEVIEIDVGDPEDPFDDDVTENTIAGGVVTVGALQSASFDEGVVRVRIALDGEDDRLQAYVADAGTPFVNGYSRFTQQESGLNRAYAALAREGEGLIAVVAMDGGQFNRFFGGATVVQDSYTTPDEGLIYYQGNYAGLLNFDGELSAVGVDAPDVIRSLSPNDITGKVYLIADFVDVGRNGIEGAVYDRVANISVDGIADPATTNLKPLILVAGTINADGTFAGRAEFDNSDGAGSYSGAFGGTEAAQVAGIIALSGDFVKGATDASDMLIGFTGRDFALAQEYGIFVIDQCPSGADSCFDPLPIPQP